MKVDGVSGWHVLAAGAGAHAPDLPEQVRHILDPLSATATIHWGRNYLYAAVLKTAHGPLPVVVKQFRNQGWKRRIERRWRGSKAERSWHVAHALVAAGFSTPAPLILAESVQADGPSCLVTARLEDAHEVRHFFHRLAGDDIGGFFPEVEPEALLGELGRFARRLHDAGFWYRDLSMGNVLARASSDGLDLWLVDLNRVRCGRTLGMWRRSRDICRLPVRSTRHRRAFLAGYWGTAPTRWSPRWWVYAASVEGYILKHWIKNTLRRRQKVRGGSHGGMHNAHIPKADAGASLRDRVVWDPLTDQPHQHAGWWSKLLIRVADAPNHLGELSAMVRCAPRVRREYRALEDASGEVEAPFAGVGVAVRPWPADPEGLLAAVEELGVRHVLLRLHPWQERHDDEEALAAALTARGIELSFALPQNRDLVRDRARWRRSVAELGERFSRYGRYFQIGQAPNRSKWGVWVREEYVGLYVDAAEVLRPLPGVVLMGPAIIDFELQVTAALVNRRTPGLFFDVVSSLLYVDRRGAPEARQLGFDALAKVRLLAAIARTGRACTGRCWITEVNWPLWEGPHSPAGRTVSVDEQRQADYLVRYLLPVCGSGLVERVFWWQLVARGYGLICPEPDGRLRRRPAFFALQTLLDELGEAQFLGPREVRDGVFVQTLSRNDGKQTAVVWRVSGEAPVELSRPVVAGRGRDGVSLDPAACVLANPSPRYLRLG